MILNADYNHMYVSASGATSTNNQGGFCKPRELLKPDFRSWQLSIEICSIVFFQFTNLSKCALDCKKESVVSLEGSEETAGEDCMRKQSVRKHRLLLRY